METERQGPSEGRGCNRKTNPKDQHTAEEGSTQQKEKKVGKAKEYKKGKEENGRGKRKQGVTIALVCARHFTILG